MPAYGKKYKAAKTAKVPKMPTAGSSGMVTSGKLTMPCYGPHKTMGTLELKRKA